jgi:hypothetical protein
VEIVVGGVWIERRGTLMLIINTPLHPLKCFFSPQGLLALYHCKELVIKGILEM